MSLKIFPSLLSADFGKLQSEINRLESFVDGFHFDVMDGHFVPNLTMGAPVLKKLSTGKIFDVHLMVTNPDKRIEEFAKAGAHMISFHVEATGEKTEEVIRAVQNFGMKAGLAIKPKTPLSSAQKFFPLLDFVLIMSVEPGFSGQEFMPHVLEKVRTLKNEFPDLAIEMDGGINDLTIDRVREAGTDMVVTGAYLFGADDPQEAIGKLRA